MARIKYPQAIACGADFGVIMLDKEVWSSEMIVVKRGDDMGEMLYDESVNWEDDPRGGSDHPLRVPHGGSRAVSEPVFTMGAVDVGAASAERSWASSPPNPWLLLQTNWPI